MSGRLPSRLGELPPAVRRFVEEHLKPRLSTLERDRLEKAEGKWPLYPKTLVELADHHMVPFPTPPDGAKRFNELPKDDQRALERLAPDVRKQLLDSEGKWPDFALRVVETARRNNIELPVPLGPTRADEFEPSIRDYIRNVLEPALEPNEKERLQRAEGRWPAYPRTVLSLGRQHRLPVPGMVLPGPREYWNKFRARSTETPDIRDATLREFVRSELTQEERIQLRLQPFDESARSA